MKTTHQIIPGDCLLELKKIPDESVDLILTDPPFNIGKDYGTYKDKMNKKEYIEWCEKWLSECIRIMKPTGSFYLFNYPENNAYLMPFLDKNLIFRRWMTWHYPTNTGHSKKNYTRTQHSILFYTKSEEYTFNKDAVAQPYRNPTDKRIKELIKNGKKGTGPYDVFNFNIVKNVSKEKTSHPCQLPKELLKVFVKASTNEGDLILDAFGGSFSTAAVAKELNRNSISIEINPKYCKIGKERLLNTNPLNAFV